MNPKKAYNNPIKLYVLIIILMVIAGCRSHWSTSARLGYVLEEAFLETIPFEFDSKLIIIPVSIKGKTYRFLYDTGAPFGISKQLQQELEFKVVSKSTIKDSDNNRSQTQWVQVDTVLVGEIPFCGVAAFVADFHANPVLSCFKVDGIIGSNNIRLCNWLIDYENKQLHFTNQKADTFGILGFDVPFEFNRQFTMVVELKSGPVTLKNIDIDTGSNGDLSILPHQFDTLVKYNQTKNIYTLNGVKQSGILGQVTPIKSRHTQVDSLKMGHLSIPNVEIGTGSSRLIGNEILSRYNVVIDSYSQKMIFKKNRIEYKSPTTFGFRPGSSDGEHVYVQSVFSDSPSSEAGVLPNMEILNFDSLDFKNTHDICDFVKHLPVANQANDNAILTVKTENGDTITYHLKKKELYK